MLSQAVKYIQEQLSEKYSPKTAMILGSGLGSLADEIKNPVKIKYHEIPGFKQSTIDGHVGQLVTGKLAGKDVIIMQGRIHCYEGHTLAEVAFPVKVMRKLGVEKLIITNAAGAVNETFNVGELMIIKDHINLMGSNPLVGRNDNDLGTRFPDMSEVYDKKLISLAQKCADKLNIKLEKGVYAANIGPSYETPAEIKMLRIIGADTVGMSTVPEAIVANYCGMSVIGISCITNFAAGIKEEKLSHQEVIEAGQKVREKFSALVKEILKKL